MNTTHQKTWLDFFIPNSAVQECMKLEKVICPEHFNATMKEWLATIWVVVSDILSKNPYLEGLVVTRSVFEENIQC